MARYAQGASAFAAGPAQAYAAPDYCPPVCPECGGLECLCRPRFFAGQILTDEDLNALQNYLIEKNRLHNRYLHGWGVVCGLEVRCHACDNYVTVETGYALSPCGDDIIVCRQDTVDVCALIGQCRRVDRRYPECEPPRPTDTNCAGVTEDWVLAICYDEKTARRVTPLRGGGGMGGCRCGGAGSCGCGCRSSGNGHANGHGNGARSAPQSCEPTRICEGYAFSVYKAPRPDPAAARGAPQSEMAERIVACLKLLLDRLGGLAQGVGKDPTPAQLYALCCDLKERLLDFIAEHPIYDCTAYERLSRIVCPSPPPLGTDASHYGDAVRDAFVEMATVAAEYLRYCICSALLPACPEPVASNCVPLATVTIRKSDCRVLRVCNIGPRRFVVTFPNLGYWLNLSGLSEVLRQTIERLCCRPFSELKLGGGDRPAAATAGEATTSTAPGSVSMAQQNDAVKTGDPRFVSPTLALLSETWSNRTRTTDSRTLLLGALGVRGENDLPLASQVEMDNPVPFIAINQVLRPVVEALFAADVDRELAARQTADKTGAAAGVPSPGAPDPGEVARLSRMVEELQRTVAAQGQEIQKMKGGGNT